MSKRITVNFTEEEYELLKKSKPKGASLSSFVSRTSIDALMHQHKEIPNKEGGDAIPASLEEIKKMIQECITSASGISEDDSMNLKEIQKRSKEFPLKFTQLNDANVKTLRQVNKLHERFDELIRILQDDIGKNSGQTNLLNELFGGGKKKKNN